MIWKRYLLFSALFLLIKKYIRGMRKIAKIGIIEFTFKKYFWLKNKGTENNIALKV